MPDTREARLLAKTNKHGPGGCWLWTGNTAKNGYGRIWDGRGQGYAHKMSYELFCGSVPSGLFVLHKCDVRNCLNPGHLFLGTQLDNVRDRVAKGRSGRSVGEKNGAAKLTPDTVLRILTTYERTGSLALTAAAHQISKSHVWKIVNHKSWAHLNPRKA